MDNTFDMKTKTNNRHYLYIRPYLASFFAKRKILFSTEMTETSFSNSIHKAPCLVTRDNVFREIFAGKTIFKVLANR